MSNAYELVEISVSPQDLLLDPTNPRITLKTNMTADGATLDSITAIQDYLMSVIQQSEFHVTDLVRSIANSGFMDVGNRMIVEEIDGSGKYLVLEGNRRLAAIRKLESSRIALAPEIRRSIWRIKVHELRIPSGFAHLEEELKFKLLGMIHVNGQLDWGAMERALYVYKTYMYELRKRISDLFVYVPDYSRPCAKNLNMSLKAFRTELATYRVYDQLHEGGYPVTERDYSIINLAVKTRGLNNDYFELHPVLLQFSDQGMERFASLCIGDEEGSGTRPPIGNPSEFRSLTHIYRNGSAHELEQVASRAATVADVVDRVSRRMDLIGFRKDLEKIERRMSEMRVADARGTDAERTLLRRIRTLADRMLAALE